MMGYLKVKRFFDILISGILLIILSPVMLIVAIAVKLDSKGEIIFKQNRLTKDGRVFQMYKFRSMCQNAQNMGTGINNYAGDFRVTRVGGFIRKTSLDELPQLVNVLKGDMSLIGPRPPVEKLSLGDYEDLTPEYKKRFQVKGGITGLAQVNGRNELPWEEKIIYDNRYVDRLKKEGIKVDLEILFKTVAVVLGKEGILEEKDEALSGKSDEEVRNAVLEKNHKMAGKSRDRQEK